MPNHEPNTAQFEAAAKWAELGSYSFGNPIMAVAESRLQLYGINCHYIVWEGFSTDLAGNNVPLIIAPRLDPAGILQKLYCRDALLGIAPRLESKTYSLDGHLNLVASSQEVDAADDLTAAATQALQEAYTFACGFIVDAFRMACLPTSEASLSVMFLRHESQFIAKVDEIRNQLSA